MAIRKSTASKSVSKTSAAAPISSTPVRNSAVPPRMTVPSPARKSSPTHDQIARRAYEIWQSGNGGSQDDNWFRAERELRGM